MSRQNVQTAEREDAAAALLVVRDVLTNYALLCRAVDHANLWHELAWDGEQAARDARRDVERGRRALEVVGNMAAARGGGEE